MYLYTSRESFAILAPLSGDSQAACEAAMLKISTLKPRLAQNSSLSEASWLKLYTGKISVEMACALAGRDLSSAQRSRILTTEKRVMPLHYLIQGNALTRPEQEALLPLLAKEQLAREYVESSWAEPDLAKQVALKTGGQVLLDFLATHTGKDLSLEEAGEILARFEEWAPSLEGKRRGFRARSEAITLLLARSPRLIRPAVETDQTPLLQAAASSHHLTDEDLQWKVSSLHAGAISAERGLERQYVLLALVNNPVVSLEVISAVRDATKVHPALDRIAYSAQQRLERKPAPVGKPYEEVDDPEQVRWLVFRALPSAEYQKDARPFEVLALAKNPHLGGYSGRIRDQLTYYMEGVTFAQVQEAAEEFSRLYPEMVRDEFLEEVTSRYEDTRRPYAYPSLRQVTPDSPGDLPLTALATPHLTEAVWGFLSERLGTSQAAWENFLSLADEFSGSLGELAEIASLV